MLTISGKEVLTTIDELVDPKHTALLLVDLQNDFVAYGGYLDKAGYDISASLQLIPKIKKHWKRLDIKL